MSFHKFQVRRLILPAIVMITMMACGFSANFLPTPTAELPGEAPTAEANNPALPNTGGNAQQPAATEAAPASGLPAAQAQTTAEPTPTSPAPVAALSNNLTDAIRMVTQKVKPAVVQITNQQVQRNGFNQPYTVPAGVGSGVIYDKQGHILTNNHVVEGAESLLVTLPDERSFPAKLIGADPQTDLAVVQINGDNLPVATLGDSRRMQVGDWVVAIGNALGLPGGPTVSTGVVSAVGRSVQEPGDQNSQTAGPLLFDLIQTDAPINPGNSGGALVNLAGEVIGINTLVAGQAEPGVQAQGIGFAISMATAKPIADQLASTGKVVHPYMGVGYQPLNAAIAAQLGIRQTQGVIIGNIVQGGPADQAGLQENDVITAIDGQKLVQESDLGRIITSHKPGDTITLTVVRGNQTRNVPLKLGTFPQ